MEKIIYNCKKRKLIDVTDYRRNKRLSKNLSKIMMLLSDNEIHSIEEINEFLYGKNQREICVIGYKFTKTDYKKDEFVDDKVIIRLIYRLKKKIKNFKEIEIKNKRGIGYYLKGDVYIT